MRLVIKLLISAAAQTKSGPCSPSRRMAGGREDGEGGGGGGGDGEGGEPGTILSDASSGEAKRRDRAAPTMNLVYRRGLTRATHASEHEHAHR